MAGAGGKGSWSYDFLTEEMILENVQEYYNLTGHLTKLGGIQDIYYQLVATDSQKYVVKYLNKCMTWEDIRFQHQILDYLESFHMKQQFTFPYPMNRSDGSKLTYVELTDQVGEKYYMCVLSYIDGDLLSEFKYLHCSTLFEIGKDVATFNKLLKSFPLSDDYARHCEWDMRRSYDVCDQRKSAVEDSSYQQKLMLLAYKNYEIVLRNDLALRHQLVHGDLVDYNIVVQRDSLNRPRIKGVVDFGDIVESWLIGDLAISIVTLLNKEHQQPISMMMPIIRGFCSVTPLNEIELRCLWHLILLRAILLFISISHMLQNDGEGSGTHEYLVKELEVHSSVLEKLLAIPLQEAISAVLLAGGCNLALEPRPEHTSNFISEENYATLLRLEDNNNAHIIPVDLTLTNPLFVNGNWASDETIVAKVVRQAIVDAHVVESDFVDQQTPRILTGRLLSSKSFSMRSPAHLMSRSSSNAHLPASTQQQQTIVNLFEIKFGSSWFNRCEIRSLEQPRTISTFSIYYAPKGLRLFAPWNGKARVHEELVKVEMLFQELKRINRETRFGSFTSTKILEISNDEYTLLIYGLYISSPMMTSEWEIRKGDKIGEVNSEVLEQNYCPIFVQFFKNPCEEMQIYPKYNSVYPLLYVSEEEWEIYRLFCFDPIVFINGTIPITDSHPAEPIVAKHPSETTIASEPSSVNSVPPPIQIPNGPPSQHQKSPLEKRVQFVAASQEFYYQRAANNSNNSQPPQIERGFQEFLYDIHGRGYLDMVNNVAVVGHSHQKIADQAYRQLTRLNTNSRFIYSALGDFAEKILSTIPENLRQQGKLNRVFFVNSGSEATDLALRIARSVVSERRMKAAGEASKKYEFHRNVVCIQGGYHGVTTASDEVSTTLNDNPRSLETRAAWIHLVPMPNHYRGVYRCSVEDSSDRGEETDQMMTEMATKYADLVREKVESMKQSGCAPAAFIAEPLSGNAGGVILPPTYLKQVYEIIHQAGGLCINDEVQVGYGRLGNVFWGFEEHGIVPDILTMAKAAGNGHPLGFVITSEEIAREFHQSQGSFFSSAGGGPVSCVVGMTVLDVIQEEELQMNALTVGNYLKEKLLVIQKKYPQIIGCIHGHGLYQGIEIIKSGGETSHSSGDSSSTSVPPVPVPGTDEAYALCARLLSLGVITHNTGDYSNVLKIKPPLCFSKADADFFCDALEIALEGW